MLTPESLNEAISILEDKELSIKYIVLRGARFNDMRGWDMDPQTKEELRVKGVIKVYAGANILITSAAALDEALLIPDKEAGKMPIREGLKTESIQKQLRFKTGWLIWSEHRIIYSIAFLSKQDSCGNRELRKPTLR